MHPSFRDGTERVPQVSFLWSGPDERGLWQVLSCPGGIGDIDSGTARCFLDKEGIDGEETESIAAQAMGSSLPVLEGLRDALRPQLRLKGRAQSLSYSGSTASANPPVTSGEFSLKGEVLGGGQGVSGGSAQP